MKEFEINLLTPKKLVSNDERMVVLDLICHVYPALAPERYGSYEPLRQVFDPAHPEDFLKEWDHDILWKRKLPRVEGGVWSAWAPHLLHGWLSLSVGMQKVDLDALVRFVQEASDRLEADFGALHLLTEPDLALGGANGTVMLLDPEQGRYALSVTTHDLRKYIPDLYWATAFGPAYVRHFGRERILAAPAPIIRELSSGGIYLQCSESLLDLETDTVHVNAVRQAVKAHLDQNSFFDPSAPADHRYAVPEFQFHPA